MGEPIKTRKGKSSGRGKHNAQLGRVVQVKKGAEELRSFGLSGKEIFSDYDKTKSKVRRTKKTGAKRRHIAGRTYNTCHGRSKATLKWQSVRITLHTWFTKTLNITAKRIQALLTAARASGGKDECQVRLTGIVREYCMGTEICRLGDYSFRGTVTAGDGSNQTGGEMGAGYVNLRKT